LQLASANKKGFSCVLRPEEPRSHKLAAGAKENGVYSVFAYALHRKNDIFEMTLEK